MPKDTAFRDERVTLAHGGGGKAMRELIESVFASAFGPPGMEDQARLSSAALQLPGARLAFTTDSFVVDPVEFPGGDIGKIAVCGTVNDLAVGGAQPLWLSAAFIIEEGTEIALLRRIVASMAEEAAKAGVRIVTGDTKVVGRGSADKVFVTTSGVGAIPPGRELAAERIRPGDVAIVNGVLGDHAELESGGGAGAAPRRPGACCARSGAGSGGNRPAAPASGGVRRKCRARTVAKPSRRGYIRPQTGKRLSGRHVMRIAVLGGDGFVGWPTVLHLSEAGHDVHIIDNLSRRWIDTELGVQSLTPMDSVQERCRIWHEVTGRRIHFHLIDVAKDYEIFKAWLTDNKPDAIIHFAEQRAAPYSMKTDRHKVYTVNNNVNATHNVLAAMVETGVDAHLVHLGTMGVYGYSTIGAAIPEGYLPVDIAKLDGEKVEQEILYPTRPGSVYHMTKSLDQILFQFYAQNDGLRITDLHQGIVWGTHTDQTRRHDQLINRFDYDGDYGTVLNRFLIQAAIGYPLTVHGTGGQTRAFIHVQDSVRCIELALGDAPERGDRVKIFNQMTETHRVRDLAEMISKMTGAKVAYLPNPRKEAAENDLIVKNDQFLALGLDPITLAEGLLEEVVDVAKKFAHRVDRSRVPAVSGWTKELGARVDRDPEGKALREVG